MKKMLLLGAGFSYELGMPLANELTKIFLGIFTKETSIQFTELLANNEPFGSSRPINKKAINEAINIVLDYKNMNNTNYEELLSKIQRLGDSPDKNQSDIDSYHYVFDFFYSLIHDILNVYQIKSYQEVYVTNSSLFEKMASFFSNEETWVFTLNHDIFLECLALDLKIPITYGDKHQITFPVSNRNLNDKLNFTYSYRNELRDCSQSYFKGQRGINLVKIHGGLSELEYNDHKQLLNQTLSLENSSQLMINFIKSQCMCYYEGENKTPCGRHKFVTNNRGDLDVVVQSMLTGGSKYSLTSNEKKGEEKLKLFSESIKDADELTVIGYGFGDKHINYRISNAMVLNQKLKIVIVDPVHKPIPDFLEQFNYNNRIILATCGAPHWFDYLENKTWNNKNITEHIQQHSILRRHVFDFVEKIFSNKNSR